jgi:hypothetical protein
MLGVDALLRIPFCCVTLHDKVKAVGLSTMLWSGYPMMQHYIPEEWNPWQHH